MANQRISTHPDQRGLGRAGFGEASEARAASRSDKSAQLSVDDRVVAPLRRKKSERGVLPLAAQTAVEAHLEERVVNHKLTGAFKTHMGV